MESTSAKSAIHESATVETVEIPADVLEALEALPDKRTWEPWKDEVLRKYWGKKKQSDVAEMLGYSTHACKRRYEELNK